MVKFATHKNSILDLIYTNIDGYYNTPVHKPGIGLSVHQVIVMSPRMPDTPRPKRKVIKRRKQGRKERQALIRAVDQVDWTHLYRLETCEEQLSIFYEILHGLLDDLLPLVTSYRNSNDQPWVTDEFHETIRKRQYYFHKGETEQYRFYRNEANRQRKLLQKKYYEKKLAKLKVENTRLWWKDINEIVGKQGSSSCSSLLGLANSISGGNMNDLAEEINRSFQQVTKNFEPLELGSPMTGHNPIPEQYVISVEEVMKSLQKINTSKAVGPDMIPNWLLKECALTLAPPLCSIWNASLREGWMPQVWKFGDICPLPKVCPPTDISKHLRPITLTPVLSKCLEKYP